MLKTNTPNFFKSNTTHVIESQPLIDTQGVLAKPIRELCEITGVVIPEHADLSTIVDVTQKAWNQRNSGKERSEFINKFSDIEKTQILSCFQKLGWIDAIEPTKVSYDDIYVMGAKAQTTKNRLEYLIELWEQGIRCKTIVFLSGQRELVGGQEDEYLEQGLKTESEMVKKIWLETPKPQALAKCDYVIIDAPKWIDHNGKEQRPNTVGTIEALLNSSACPKKESSNLVIANQPYVARMHLQISDLLSHCTIETVGPLSSIPNPAIYLNELAIQLYAYNNRKILSAEKITQRSLVA